MQHFCNSWRVRILLVIVLRLNRWAESIVSLHTRLLRPSTHFCHFLQCILHSSHVVDNAREDPFPLPRIFMTEEVHLRQLATSTYQITPSWTPSSCKPEESHYLQRAPTRWTHSALWIQRYQRFSWRLRRASLLPTRWKHCRFSVSTTATSAADGNIPRCRHSMDWLRCWAMWTQWSGLLWDTPTNQHLLPIWDAWTVQIYPVWDQEEGHEDVLWQHAEGRKHRSAFPKSQTQGQWPEAHG